MRSGVWSRRLVVGAIVVSGLVSFAPPALAVPRNPSNAEIAQSQATVRGKAAEVGRITAELVRAEAGLQAAAHKAEVSAEKHNKARVDEQLAAKATAAAVRGAAQARADVEMMRDRLDQLATDNYRTGGSLGPLTALVTASNPADVMHEAGLLSVMSNRQLDTLAQLDRARTRQANAKSRAQAALQRQVQARQSAAAAKHAAEKAQVDNQRTVEAFAATKTRLTGELAQAQAQAGLLVAARQAALRRAQAEAAARAAAARSAAAARAAAAEAAAAAARAAAAAAAARPAPRTGGGTPAPQPAPRPRGSNVAAIAVDAALSQLGKPYVWGAAGPDSYDCSGLMLWAYARAGLYLPHFSGYQYSSGGHIPLGSLIPGDLVFWSDNGAPSGIHHVAMYIGGGTIVEAATEGVPVRTRSLYYSGLLPLGTRPY